MSRTVKLRIQGNAANISLPKALRVELDWQINDILVLTRRGEALVVQRMRPPVPVTVVGDGSTPQVGE